MLTYQGTPTQEVFDTNIAQAGIRLLIKREDLNHPFVTGNKWWKLKYNLKDATDTDKDTLVTYGGAYSNHIYATAAAAHELNLKSIGIIRGEETLPLNTTLLFAKEKGMKLIYISRDAYRKRDQENDYLKGVENYYLIPEGGSNPMAVKGVCEFAKKLGEDYDYLCCPVGTGGTLAGLIQGVDPSKKILGFSVIKGGQFLIEEIRKLSGDSVASNWELLFDYHFGGYAKANPGLFEFIKDFKQTQHIPLEFIYTAKMLVGIYDLVSKNFFARGTTILAIHTGGLQITKS